MVGAKYINADTGLSLVSKPSKLSPWGFWIVPYVLEPSKFGSSLMGEDSLFIKIWILTRGSILLAHDTHLCVVSM